MTDPTTTVTRTARITPAVLIKSERQHWFWHERIPMGTPTIFAGRGGEGKSTFAFWLAAQITLGTLDGDLQGNPSPVLIWSGEDRWETVIIPRLVAAGADMEHVGKLSIETNVDAITLETTPALPDDLLEVRNALIETGARLVIFDPITSTMAGDLHKVADTRRTLDGLARIAAELNIVVLCIMHFNKGQGAASDKLSGSHAFRDASRSVFLFATDEDTGNRIVTQDKGNYSAAAGSSLAFSLDSVAVPTDDGDIVSVAKITMLGESDISVGDIINRSFSDADDHEDRNACQSFVLDYLNERDGLEAPASDVLKAGKAAGFSDNELKNARKRSRSPVIESRKSGFGAGWVWGISSEGVTKESKGSGGQALTPTTPWVTPSPSDNVIDFAVTEGTPA